MIHFKESCLLLIIVTLCQLAFGSKDVGKIEQSRLILEYNWPNVIKGLKRLPHVVSCNHFYLTRPDGTHTIKTCPDGEGYDFLTRRCKAKELAKCWSKQLKTDLESQFVCPFPWGLYPDVVNCSKFFNCLNGKSFIRKCPVDSLFDKAERKCVDAKRAMCADKTDTVEPGYKCPYTWGFFTYKKDCSKYYECLHKNPSLRSCKRNMLFDNQKRKCLPKTFVECGARLNPYEILELSSSKSDPTTDSILSVDIVSTLSSNYSPITGYSTSKESTETRGDRTETSKYPNDEYSSQHTTPEEHVSPSDSSYLKTGDSLGSITEDNSNSTGSFNDTDSKQIGTLDPSIENISRLTGAFTYTDSKLVDSSDSTIEDKSNSTGSFNDTDSKRIGTLDPSIENISRLKGAFMYTDSKLVGSSDTTIEDNSNSTESFNDTDSKQTSTLDPNIENISRLTEAFTYTDSKLVGSSDSTIEDKSNSTESFNDTDSKRITFSVPATEDVSRLTGEFTFKDSKRIPSSNPITKDILHLTGGFAHTDSKLLASSDPTKESLLSTGITTNTDSKRIISSDPTIKDILHLTGGFSYGDSKLTSSSDQTIDDNLRSTGKFTYTDSKIIASSKDILRSTGEFIYIDSKRIGLSDTTNKDNLRSTEEFAYKDSKKISSSAQTTEDVLHFTGEFVPTGSKMIYPSDPAAKTTDSTGGRTM